MKKFRHLNSDVNHLSSLISIKNNQVISLALLSENDKDIRLFSLSKDEIIRNEKYEMETLYLCLEGKICIKKNDEDFVLLQNDILLVSIDDKSSITALEDAKMLQIMIGE